MTIAIILGTRPEIIKMAPIIRECERRALDYFVLHTGQHYSHQMDSIFFEQLELPAARYNLDVGSASHAKQTGRIMAGVETGSHERATGRGFWCRGIPTLCWPALWPRPNCTSRWATWRRA